MQSAHPPHTAAAATVAASAWPRTECASGVVAFGDGSPT
jgi:hypothetical protein